MCRHYAPNLPDACDEEDAPDVRNATTANFCDYFVPTPEAYDGMGQQADNEARAQLESLFGNASESVSAKTDESEADQSLQQARDLFKK